MKLFKFSTAVLTAVIMTTLYTSAEAAVTVSEVAPWGSSSSYAGDWFELTNTGTVAVDLTGWRMDDNSKAFGSAVALRGVTSLAAGQSVVFIEGGATSANDSTINASFNAAWFGSNVSKYLTLGNYGGSGVGLSATADAVNIYNAAGTYVTGVNFALSTTGKSFDNALGMTGTATSDATISTLSAVGTNGAFLSASGLETGSPGSIAAVPEPETFAMLLAGLGLIGFIGRRRIAA